MKHGNEYQKHIEPNMAAAGWEFSLFRIWYSIFSGKPYEKHGEKKGKADRFFSGLASMLMGTGFTSPLHPYYIGTDTSLFQWYCQRKSPLYRFI